MPFKNPLYEAEIVTSNCAVELLVNEVFSFCNFRPGGLSLDWPINELILESGRQTFELRMLPFEGQVTLSPKAQARVNIYVRDALVQNGTPRQLIYEGTPLQNGEAFVPLLKDRFTAQVPYALAGWKEGVDLSKEKEELLRAELLTWNQKLLHIYRDSDLSAYLEAYKDRNSEFDRFFYSTPEEMQQTGQNIFHSKFKDLTALPNEGYRLCFYAGGKLASLRLPYQPPGFKFEPKTKTADSMGITLTTLFQRKAKGAPLTIIR